MLIVRSALKLCSNFTPHIVCQFHVSSTTANVLNCAPNATLDKCIFDRYMALPIPECKVQVNYVWIDGSGENIRSKSRTLDFVPLSHKDVPNWTFDGEATNQADGKNNCTDTFLVPIALYNDPIRRGDNKLVLCETFDSQDNPTRSNHRCKCVESLNEASDNEIIIGFDQEYQMMGPDNRPFGWPQPLGEPGPEGCYYCGVGAEKVYAGEINESFYRACLYSGINIYGTHADIMLSQWEYQTGPTLGIKAGDDLWMSRYLLTRIAEDYGVSISFHPKLYPNYHGAGCLTNFSTKAMREEGGLKIIEEALKKLERKHVEHIKVYDAKSGEYNKIRLKGVNEAKLINKFKWGIGDRHASVRIPKAVANKKMGYFQDRRPAANADPYLIMNALIKTCILDKECDKK